MGLLFVNLITWLGAVASFVRPIYGLCVYIFLAIVRPEVVWSWSIEQGSFSKIVGIALLLSWTMYGFGGLNFGRSWLPALALFCFWIWSGIASLTADYQAEPWLFMDNLTKIVLPVLVGLTLIKTRKDLMLISWTLGIAAAFLSYRENESYWQWGVADGDNQAAHTFGAMCGFLFFLAFSVRSWWVRLPILAMSLGAAHAVMFHMSRGAMLGVAVTVLLTLVIIPKTPTFYAVMVCAILAGVRLAGPHVVEEFLTTFKDSETRDESATSRTEFWIAMAKATVDNPLFGVGPRNWRQVSSNYGIPNREGHGAWQQLAAETGVPGVSFILLFYGSIWFALFPLAWGSGPPEYESLRPFAQMYVVSFSAWFVSQVFGSFYLVEFPYYVALVGAGTLKVLATEAAPPDDEWFDDEFVEDDDDYLDVELPAARI